MTDKIKIKRGDEVELDIESLAFGGRGLARHNGFVIFVDGAIPGQRVRARLLRKKKGYGEARVQALLQESPEQIEPRCPHFGECGGCRLQHLDYDAQLKYKRQQVMESLQHIGGFDEVEVENMLASPDKFYYRNKMEFSFGQQRWISKHEIEADDIIKPKDFALGLHVRGRHDKILDLDTCYLQSPLSVDILLAVKEFVRNSAYTPYNTQDHSGFWRNLVVREGKNTEEVMINIVTADSPKGLQEVESLSRNLTEQFEMLTTVVHNINRKKAQVAYGDEERILFGPGIITEKIADHRFQISANSFFQTNTKAAERLYDKVIEFADPKGEETVLDLYSGAGTISIHIADQVKQVTGFEVIEDSVKNAGNNCELNEIENCEFIYGDLKETLPNVEIPTPDLIIIDPPRAGMHPDVVRQVMKLSSEKIVYVSCNPTTFARDARMLCDSGYALSKVQPVDMFPMTPHIELVSQLLRSGR